MVCRPISDRRYQPAIAVEADGEVLGASCANIEMAGLDVASLFGDRSPVLRPFLRKSRAGNGS